MSKVKFSKTGFHKACIKVAREVLDENDFYSVSGALASFINGLEKKMFSDNIIFEVNKMKKKNKTVARFEKVSYEQFLKDFKVGNFNISDCGTTRIMYDDIILPVRSTKGSAGYDFFAISDITIDPHSEILIPTGIKCKIKKGYVLDLYPRSSLGFKYRIHLCNTVGIIDSDYYNNENNEGHIMCKLYNPTDSSITIEKGNAYMQGIFTKFYLAEEEEVTKERKGGFGSTDK